MEDSLLIEEFYGSMKVEPEGECIAGSFASITLTYTAGIYGMDDLGGIKVLFRYACDQSPLQTEDPKSVGYTTAVASNGAKVELNYYLRESERPWYKVLRIRIAGQGLRKGDTISILLGNQEFGSPGVRLQTFVEPRFEFRTLVDVFSTNLFSPLKSPKIALVSGKPEKWNLILPTLRRFNEAFSLKIRAEDKWGNPSTNVQGEFFLKCSQALENLPGSFKWREGSAVHIIKDLLVSKKSEDNLLIQIRLYDSDQVLLAGSNPLIIKSDTSFLHYWGDLHGQSEETIGSNTARMYFEFARDKAFLDVMGHQGNDFQVTQELWQTINVLSEEFTEPGQFVAIPGYEYSANTALGGDRNVYFLHPYRQIHRSSHVLIPNKEDISTDSLTASELFRALIADNPDADDAVVVFAHVGGRYADILEHHDGRVETSVEIHSAWGTFEWLLHDAFKKGYRVGIVANSDDHKGRPGVAYPGSAKFGSYGGLTCFLAPELTRETIFKALKQRHHYATTGERIYIQLQGNINFMGDLFERDPALYSGNQNTIFPTNQALMGDIIRIPNSTNEKNELSLNIDLYAAAPIERIQIFNGLDLIEEVKPYPNEMIENSNRIRIIWEGAEFRARRRNAQWKGDITIVDNEIINVKSFNFWNVDAPLKMDSETQISWETYTSGNFQGVDVTLKDSKKGTFSFHTNQIDFKLPLSEITPKDTIFEAGGLEKRVRVFRIPEVNDCTTMHIEKPVCLAPTKEKDDQIYVKVTLENGHQLWSSPIYFIV